MEIRREKNQGKNRATIAVRLYKKGEVTLHTYSRKTRKILNLLRRNEWDLACLRVTYAPNIYNEAIYSNYHRLKTDLKRFTEKNLTKYLGD